MVLYFDGRVRFPTRVGGCCRERGEFCGGEGEVQRVARAEGGDVIVVVVGVLVSLSLSGDVRGGLI